MERTGSETQESTGSGPSGPAIEPGAVRLRVADLDREREFYERALGLRALDGEGEVTRLGVGDAAVVELASSPGAAPRRGRPGCSTSRSSCRGGPPSPGRSDASRQPGGG